MPKPRPIPKVDLTNYLVEDVVTVKAKDNAIRIEVGSDRCRTLMIDEKAAMSLMISIAYHAKKVWGTEFVNKLTHQVELL